METNRYLTYLTEKLISSEATKPRYPRYLLGTAHFSVNEKIEEKYSLLIFCAKKLPPPPPPRWWSTESACVMREHACAQESRIVSLYVRTRASACTCVYVCVCEGCAHAHTFTCNSERERKTERERESCIIE